MATSVGKWERRYRMLVRHPNPPRMVASRLLWHTGASRFLETKLRYGPRIRFHGSSLSAALWADPSAYRVDEDFVWTVLRENDRSIDAGANVGHLALTAARKVGKGGEVFAVEAHPLIARYLASNVKLNRADNVRVIQSALGETEGEVRFSSRRSDDQNHVSPDGLVRVPMRQLDELVPPGRIRLLKIDVEGYELPVLRGATRTLSNTDIVYSELSAGNCRRFDYEPSAIERLLLDQGFRFIRQGVDGLRLTDEPYYSSLSPESLPRTGYNLVAVRPDVSREVLVALGEAGWDQVS